MTQDPYGLTPEQVQSWSKDDILAFYSRKLKELAKLNDDLGKDIAKLREDSKQELAKLREDSKQELAKLREDSKQELAKLREFSNQELNSLKEENDQLGVKYNSLIAELKYYVEQEKKQKGQR
ncbi:MAG TPA: hypothetical protein PKZ00_11955 [Elusimicrobiota bacterium]|nr:hypothetical protein [Elusimicrobiota bacterium]